MARKILLADDSVTAQNMGRKILADAGYEVITVNNGSAALKKIAEIKPELIVLDVYMPGYSGLEVCQRLKEAQETSRIPVLLTVGKLEPFKPEEARRVGAESFIVKPFEASELLSTLSKLEDKIVPRAEASKPGRFARTMASLEEQAPQENGEGWKKRIAFPSKKKKEVEENPDDGALYNPVNRDLRTVVAHDSEKQVERGKDSRHSAGGEAVAAQPSVPKDITPEEIAALAAAAAQVREKRTADSAAKSEGHGGGEEKIESIAASVQSGMANTTGQFEAPGVEPAQVPQAHEEVMAAIASLGPGMIEAGAAGSGTIDSGNRMAEVADAEDLPVTMAVSPTAQESTGLRWTAVAVALSSEEAAVSLEQEMQQTYAAFAAAAGITLGAAAVRAEIQTTVSSVLASESSTEVQNPAPVVVPGAAVAAMPDDAASVAALTGTTQTAVEAKTEPTSTAVEQKMEAAEITPLEEAVATDKNKIELQASAVGVLENVAQANPSAAQLAESGTTEVVTTAAVDGFSVGVHDFRPGIVTAAREAEDQLVDAVAPEFAARSEAEQVEERRNELSQEMIAPQAATNGLEAASAPGEEAKIENVPPEMPQMGFENSATESQVSEVVVQQTVAEVPSTDSVAHASGAGILLEQLATEQGLREETDSLQDSSDQNQAEQVPPASASDQGVAEEDMSNRDSELAASTAAAWASWRQIRDVGGEVGAPQSADASHGDNGHAAEPAATAASEGSNATAEVAMATAAGAEGTVIEVVAAMPAATAVDPLAVASIVENVLAELRPKIVEEIARKLAAEKK